ncbi:hypothetical protein L1987_59221 [Smallanthus sonchifolius]|uniref:Uncharacterized protein n=1 Tax=Smallanthus sonchifolius TaxID=185202 RepID=A0ACB9D4M5_9ASTR|nr:hypothetical protein L1987_59221 [Smallanthus sonchifolius]
MVTPARKYSLFKLFSPLMDEKDDNSGEKVSPPAWKAANEMIGVPVLRKVPFARREITPRTAKCLPKRWWGGVYNHKHQSSVKPESERVRNAKSELLSWVEAESLRCLSAKYCPLVPSSRSRIAAAFSVDGKVLASTRYQHTPILMLSGHIFNSLHTSGIGPAHYKIIVDRLDGICSTKNNNAGFEQGNCVSVDMSNGSNG